MITIEQVSDKDVERTALYQTLSKLLDTQAMETVFSYFDENHILSMTDGYPITRSQIHDALESFFHYGASTIMTEYDKTFYQLVSDTESTA